MKAVRIAFIKQAVSSCLLFIILTTNIINMAVTSAQYDELPVEVQFDIIMKSATEKMLAEKWDEALKDYEKLINMGLELPVGFYFHYGKLLQEVGDVDKSLQNLKKYLKLAGRDGNYYNEAIGLIVKLDMEKRKLAEVAEEGQRKAGDERKKAEEERRDRERIRSLQAVMFRDNPERTGESPGPEVKTETGTKEINYPDGGKYVGDVVNGKRHGQGTFTWPNGHRYEGEWKDDNMHGQGAMFHPDGGKHVGEYIDNKATGGQHYRPNGVAIRPYQDSQGN
jgi:tetratricopeptide (TPR) repeat protein